jgi:hypothetical protein
VTICFTGVISNAMFGVLFGRATQTVQLWKNLLDMSKKPYSKILLQSLRKISIPERGSSLRLRQGEQVE